MSILPGRSMAYLSAFAPLFYQRSWEHAGELLVGAILAPGARTISSVLRVLGRDQERSYQAYHRVLNRVQWSGLAASRILLRLLIRAFAPTGPLVLGIDETLERRRGKTIAAAGIYRDPVRSSKGHFVKVRALRWVCVMLLVPIPWAERTWALPFLAALAPSERYDQEHGRRHKTITEWARQMLRLVHRWYPERELVVVGDSAYAALDFLAATRTAATIITRLRLDARLFAPAPPRRPGQKGRPRVKGARLPTLAQRAVDPADPVAAAAGAVLVRGAQPGAPGGLRHGRLAPSRRAGRPAALGTHPRSPGGLPHPGAALHRPGRGPRADHRLVRPALADGVHLPRRA